MGNTARESGEYVASIITTCLPTTIQVVRGAAWLRRVQTKPDDTDATFHLWAWDTFSRFSRFAFSRVSERAPLGGSGFALGCATRHERRDLFRG